MCYRLAPLKIATIAAYVIALCGLEQRLPRPTIRTTCLRRITITRRQD